MTSAFELSPLEVFELVAWAEQLKGKLVASQRPPLREPTSLPETGNGRRLVFVAVRRQRRTKVLLNAFEKETRDV